MTFMTRTWLLAVLALLLAGCGGNDGEGPGVSVNAVSVRTATVATEDVTTELDSIGRLVSLNAPTLASEINARVVEILADEGHPVEAGQLLLRLDTTAFELARAEAQAAIRGLEVSIANEERRVKRYRDLKTTNAMSQEGLDDAEAKLAGSRASKVAAEARLAIAEDRLAKAAVASPVNGVIDRRHVSVGDYVRPGDPLVTVTDTQALRAELPFPETVGYDLEPGQVILLASLASRGPTVETTIQHIRPQVSSINRSLMVIVDIVNPGPWRPEGTVRATVVTDRRPDTIVVPVNSVVQRPAGKVVYLYDGGSGTVNQRVVEPGRRQNGWIEILAGLQGGETVVSDGASYLSDGAAVIVRDDES